MKRDRHGHRTHGKAHSPLHFTFLSILSKEVSYTRGHTHTHSDSGTQLHLYMCGNRSLSNAFNRYICMRWQLSRCETRPVVSTSGRYTTLYNYKLHTQCSRTFSFIKSMGTECFSAYGNSSFTHLTHSRRFLCVLNRFDVTVWCSVFIWPSWNYSRAMFHLEMAIYCVTIFD